MSRVYDIQLEDHPESQLRKWWRVKVEHQLVLGVGDRITLDEYGVEGIIKRVLEVKGPAYTLEWVGGRGTITRKGTADWWETRLLYGAFEDWQAAADSKWYWRFGAYGELIAAGTESDDTEEECLVAVRKMRRTTDASYTAIDEPT